MTIIETMRVQLKSFKSKDHLNESIRAYMYKYKKQLHDHNKLLAGKQELNATGKVFKALYTHSVKIKGVSFLSNKSIAAITNLSVRSVKRATKQLQELGVVLKVHTLRKNGSDTSNTYVIKPLLSSVVDTLFKPLRTPCHPTLSHLETESFKQDLKQDDLYKNDQLLKLFEWKLKDKEVQHGSAYVQKAVDTLFKYAESLIVSEERQQKMYELLETNGMTGGSGSFPQYDWLNESSGMKYQKSPFNWLDK